jgi:hypothetical protein
MSEDQTASTEYEDPCGDTSQIEPHPDILHGSELSYRIASQQGPNYSFQAASSSSCAPFNSPLSIDQSMTAPPSLSMFDALPLQAFLARFDKKSDWVVEGLSKRWYDGTENFLLLLDAYKACEEENPKFKTGDTKLFARYCKGLTSSRCCDRVVLRLIRYRSDLCARCKKNNETLLARQRKRDRRLRGAVKRPTVHVNMPNIPQESKDWARTRSVLTSPHPSDYEPEPDDIAETYQPTLSQSTYTGVSSESVNQAPSGQPLDHTQTVVTQWDLSQGSARQVG